MPNLIDKVWFTYKARIQAHIRLERWDIHSQLLLVWYALVAATLAIVSIRLPRSMGENTDIYAAILSIALLTVSLAVTNRDFRGRSIAMRGNYLSLQRLYDRMLHSGTESQEDLERYHELLASVENHTAMDDRIFRVKNQSALSSRAPTKLEIAMVIAYKILLTSFLATLYLSPLIALYFARK